MKNSIGAALFLLGWLATSLPLHAMMEGEQEPAIEEVPKTNYAKLKPSKLLKRAERGDEGARQYLLRTVSTLFDNDELVIVFSEEIGKLPQLLKYIQNEAAASNPLAQFCLGFMCDKGCGVDLEHQQAVEWYHKAAEQGFAAAQLNLGRMYEEGNGVPQDDRQAAAWYRKAAEQGLAEAEFCLGDLYFRGRGVPLDCEMGVALYRKAAEQGFPTAQYYLGHHYFVGYGVLENNFRKALEWHHKAAEQRYKMAEGMLASLYSSGFIIPKDAAKAAQWEKLYKLDPIETLKKKYAPYLLKDGAL